MSRAQRLLELIQLLRSYRRPARGADLAETLGISLRTLYRDIAALQAQGADIAGEAGVGFQLKPGFMLPPLMFSDEELEALILGVRWVGRRTDDALAEAGRQALAKIAACLPPDLNERFDNVGLVVGPATVEPTQIGDADVAVIREAIRTQSKLRVDYGDEGGQRTRRIIWPFGLAYFEATRLVLAWCEEREDFRHFRLDRIRAVTMTSDRFRTRTATLMLRWRKQMALEESITDKSCQQAKL